MAYRRETSNALLLISATLFLAHSVKLDFAYLLWWNVERNRSKVDFRISIGARNDEEKSYKTRRVVVIALQYTF